MGSTEDLEEIINHPWFEDIEWDKLKNKKVSLNLVSMGGRAIT